MEAANLFTANLITAIHQIMVTDPAATVAMEVVRDTDINMNVVVSGRSFDSCFNWN